MRTVKVEVTCDVDRSGLRPVGKMTEEQAQAAAMSVVSGAILTGEQADRNHSLRDDVLYRVCLRNVKTRAKYCNNCRNRVPGRPLPPQCILKAGGCEDYAEWKSDETT